MAAQSQTGNIANLAGAEEKRVGESLTTQALRRLRRDRLTMLAIGILFTLALLAILAPAIQNVLGVSYDRTNVTQAFLPIGAPGHLLGTDDLGRDHLARLLFAGQVSLGIAFSAAILSIVIGVSLGIVTGYYGGVVDDLVVWVVTTLNSVPYLFLLLIVSSVILQNKELSSIIGSGGGALVIILGLLGWTGTTRLVRGQTLSLREQEYIIGARAVGASPLRIMVSHILPNLVSVVVITLAIDIGTLILVEAGLSFLGLGVKPPTPTWGNMLTNSQTFFTKGVHLVIAPGLLIVITVLCLYIIGDGIRDAFDPTTVD